MSAPYTPQEIADIRIWATPRNDGPLSTWPMDVDRWLATLDAERAKVARLREALMLLERCANDTLRGAS